MYEKLHKADAIDYRFSVQIFEDCSVLIEGHKGLISLSQEEVKIKLKQGAVTVFGSELSICYISKSELCLTGKVTGVSYS